MALFGLLKKKTEEEKEEAAAAKEQKKAEKAKKKEEKKAAKEQKKAKKKEEKDAKKLAKAEKEADKAKAEAEAAKQLADKYPDDEKAQKKAQKAEEKANKAQEKYEALLPPETEVVEVQVAPPPPNTDKQKLNIDELDPATIPTVSAEALARLARNAPTPEDLANAPEIHINDLEGFLKAHQKTNKQENPTLTDDENANPNLDAPSDYLEEWKKKANANENANPAPRRDAPTNDDITDDIADPAANNNGNNNSNNQNGNDNFFESLFKMAIMAHMVHTTFCRHHHHNPCCLPPDPMCCGDFPSMHDLLHHRHDAFCHGIDERVGIRAGNERFGVGARIDGHGDLDVGANVKIGGVRVGINANDIAHVLGGRD